MDRLLDQLRNKYPSLQFQPSSKCFWSPKSQTVFYDTDKRQLEGSWALLHEVGHALLNHSFYNSDVELLMLEVAAWEKAREISLDYDIQIDDEHIQNCLDTYREWLHRRSTCPNCSSGSLQQNPTTYSCFNCQTTWSVTAARFCRPYRKISFPIQKPPEGITPPAALS